MGGSLGAIPKFIGGIYGGSKEAALDAYYKAPPSMHLNYTLSSLIAIDNHEMTMCCPGKCMVVAWSSHGEALVKDVNNLLLLIVEILQPLIGSDNLIWGHG